jgi:hypothetical protein
MISRLATGALALLALTAPAMANVTFTDGTFDPANYTATTVFLTDPANSSFVSVQCTICGNPPGLGQAFSMNVTTTPAGVLFGAETLINNGFSYDPSTQGPITSISASVDKNLGVNIQSSGGNTFRPTIEQGGLFYAAAIAGPPLNTGLGGGFTGYNTIASPLNATNFVQYDPTNSTFGTAHPDFSGGPMLFGLTQQFGVSAVETTTAEYDNLSFVIATTTAVPEPAGMLVLGAGFAGLLVMRRRTA